MSQVNLYNLDQTELTAFVIDLGQPKFRAQQVWDWMYKRYALDFEAMGNIPKAFRVQLAEHATLGIGQVVDEL